MREREDYIENKGKEGIICILRGRGDHIQNERKGRGDHIQNEGKGRIIYILRGRGGSYTE